jgi:acyl carrier protein
MLIFSYKKKGINMGMLEDIKEVVVEQLSISPDEIKEDTKFIQDLGADRLDVVELVMALEEKFNVEIPDEVAEKLKTPADVMEYLNK